MGLVTQASFASFLFGTVGELLVHFFQLDFTDLAAFGVTNEVLALTHDHGFVVDRPGRRGGLHQLDAVGVASESGCRGGHGDVFLSEKMKKGPKPP